MTSTYHTLIRRTWIRRSVKYGSMILGILDFLKTLSELPETVQKDKTFLFVVGHLLWLLTKWPLEFLALVILVYIGLITAGMAVITITFAFLHFDESEVDAAINAWTPFAFVVSVFGAAWLECEYGFTGTFVGIGHVLLTIWQHFASET
jgi:hypothetical protein